MAGYEDITAENFIRRIKQMDKRDRTKIPVQKLIELILTLPDGAQDIGLKTMELTIQQMQQTLKLVSDMANENKDEIAGLKAKNIELYRQNNELQTEINELRQDAEEHDATDKILELQRQINDIEQYLRVNNVEIVGLPNPLPDTNETEETLIINALNSLQGLNLVVRPEDIDISHPLPSKRRDKKPVHVVRFVSRKTKFAILAAKKSDANKQFKFRDQDVFINEHLSKVNRGLFATATERKRALNYKFLWTKGGVVQMRKDDNTPVITINNEEDFEKLI